MPSKPKQETNQQEPKISSEHPYEIWSHLLVSKKAILQRRLTLETIINNIAIKNWTIVRSLTM
jgi:hypothetical protein